MGCPKCETMRRGDEHNTVHHSRECRKSIDTDMSKDEVLSKRLVDIEDQQKGGYLARRVEASDKERTDAEMAAPGSATVTGDEPRASADTMTAAVTGEVSVHRLPRSSESLVCTWIECSNDKISWAEVQEEEQRERGGGVLRPLQALTPPSKSFAETGFPESAGNPRRGNGRTGSCLIVTDSKDQSKYDV